MFCKTPYCDYCVLLRFLRSAIPGRNKSGRGFLPTSVPTLALTMHSCCSFLNCSCRPKRNPMEAPEVWTKEWKKKEHGKYWKVQIVMKNIEISSKLFCSSSSSRERSAHAMGITVFCRHRHIVSHRPIFCGLALPDLLQRLRHRTSLVSRHL